MLGRPPNPAEQVALALAQVRQEMLDSRSLRYLHQLPKAQAAATFWAEFEAHLRAQFGEKIRIKQDDPKSSPQASISMRTRGQKIITLYFDMREYPKRVKDFDAVLDTTRLHLIHEFVHGEQFFSGQRPAVRFSEKMTKASTADSAAYFYDPHELQAIAAEMADLAFRLGWKNGLPLDRSKVYSDKHFVQDWVLDYWRADDQDLWEKFARTFNRLLAENLEARRPKTRQ